MITPRVERNIVKLLLKVIYIDPIKVIYINPEAAESINTGTS